MKSLVFLMPGPGNRPTGGGKVVYEYANRLADDGYQVNIIYPATSYFSTYNVKTKFRALLGFFYHLLRRTYTPYKWFNLSRRVKTHFVWSLAQSHVPKVDLYVATSLATAEYLNKYENIDPQNKIYFIQGYESWDLGEERFLSSLRFKMRKITIAPHLMKAIEQQNSNAVQIEIGLDFDYFQPTITVEEKNKFVVSMLYHTAPLKGANDGLSAIYEVKKLHPELQAILFGHFSRPDDLPAWIEYYQQPDRITHNDIYGRSAMFIGPSHSEGFGLTLAEAMQCGCAVVCTDIGGYAAFCSDGYTALIAPVADIQTLALNIVRLLVDDGLRQMLALNGQKHVQQYTWQRAYSKFKQEIDKT